MTDSEYEQHQQEIDRLLNDPETPMHPDRIWALAEALAGKRHEPEGLAA